MKLQTFLNKHQYKILWFISVLSLLITIRGINRYNLLEQSIWSSPMLGKLSMLLVCVFMVVFIANRLPINRTITYLSILGIYIANVFNVGALFSIALIGASAFCLGDLLLRLNVKEGQQKPLIISLSLVIGLAAFVTVIQFFVHFPINTRWLYSILFVLIGMTWLIKRAPLYSFKLSELNNNKMPLNLVTEALLVFTIVLNVIVAVKPEVGADALAFHLWAPNYIEHFSYWHFDIKQGIWALIPMGGDFIYGLTYILGGEYAVRLINLSFLLLLAYILYCVLIKTCDKHIVKLLLAAFLSTPLIGLEAGSLLIENFWSLLIFAAFLMPALEISYRLKWLSGTLLLAVALATKVIAVFFVPVFILYFIYTSLQDKRNSKEVMTVVLMCSVLMLLVGGKPYFYALFITGNPVFPFMNSVFKSEFYDVTTSFNPRYSNGYNPFSILYDLTIHSSRYMEGRNGGFGFLWLVMLPVSLVFAFTHCTNKWVWFSILAALFCMAGVFSQQVYLRYIMPALPFLLIVIAYFLSKTSVIKGFSVYNSGTLVFVILLNIYFFSSSGYHHSDLYNFDKQQYMKRIAPERLAIDFLNAYDPGNNVIFLGERFCPSNLKGKAYGTNWYFPEIRTHLKKDSSVAGLNKLVHEYQLKYIIISSNDLDERLELKKSVTKLFKPVRRMNSIFIYKYCGLENEVDVELLRNASFNEGVSDWFITGDPMVENGKVEVNSQNFLSQAVNVRASMNYEVTYHFECAKKSLVRLQVSWLDENRKFLSVDLEKKTCLGKQTFSTIYQSPMQSKIGVLYVTSHNDSYVSVTQVSMKQHVDDRAL